ncbi:hypothetical protein [Psychroserpens luteolus]|uniref:hypothetical protein n=1 Tax=Psychroserpens luteolus TaxID=2855840 RepID=UPI001E50FB99|nr:hypothetical protein [Psychroserpens luteolus]MCD2258292.1 hypothetical protein [Psychroserpens luteolus]
MNLEIKEIIDEMIEFSKTREPKKHMKDVVDKYGQATVYSLNGKLLLWHKLVFLEQELSEKYNLSEHKTLQEQFDGFFKVFITIGRIFSFNKTYIGWANNISKNEQEEIRNYIHENYKAQVRIRRHKT